MTGGTPAPSPPGPAGGTVVADALRFDLRVLEHGRGSGPPIVLVHGFGAGAHSWRHWVPALAREHRVLVVELTGFGDAPCPPGAELSPEAQAARLTGWLRSRSGPPPLLVGHSLGAPVVLMATLRLEEDEAAGTTTMAGTAVQGPAGVAVVAGAVYEQRFPPYMGMARIPGLGELLMAPPPPRAILAMGIRGIVADPASVTPALVEGYRRPLTSRRRRRAILRAARSIRPSTARVLSRQYPRIRAPVLALWGSLDPVVPPAFAHRLARDVVDGSAVLLDGVGHLVPEEAPRESLEVFTRWLRAHRDGSSPPRGSGASVPPPGGT